MAAVRAALASVGPLTRSQLRERVAAAGVRTEGQAMVHILALASNLGLIVRGPVAGRDQAFVLVGDWLGAAPPTMGHDVVLGRPALPGRACPGVGSRPGAAGPQEGLRRVAGAAVGDGVGVPVDERVSHRGVLSSVNGARVQPQDFQGPRGRRRRARRR